MTCAAWNAIDRLRNVRDTIELALRPPGERPTVARPTLEAILDDVIVAGRLIRKMAECQDG